MRNQTSDLQILHSDTLPLSHRDSMVSEVYYKVHMTHVLHTARISKYVDSIMFVDINKRDGRFFGTSCLQALLANIACNIALKLSNHLVTWLNASWCISWQPANSRRIVGQLFENNWPMMVNQLLINTQPTMLALISTLLELQSTFSLLLADFTPIHRSGFEWLN